MLNQVRSDLVPCDTVGSSTAFGGGNSSLSWTCLMVECFLRGVDCLEAYGELCRPRAALTTHSLMIVESSKTQPCPWLASCSMDLLQHDGHRHTNTYTQTHTHEHIHSFPLNVKVTGVAAAAPGSEETHLGG